MYTLRTWKVPSGVYLVEVELHVIDGGPPRFTLRHSPYNWELGSYHPLLAHPSVGQWRADLDWEAPLDWTFADPFHTCGLPLPATDGALPPHTRYTRYAGDWYPPLEWIAPVGDQLYRASVSRYHPDLLRLESCSRDDLRDATKHRDHPRFTVIAEVTAEPAHIHELWEAFVVDPASFILTHLIL